MIRDKRDYTPKERLFGNLKLLKERINNLKDDIQQIEEYLNHAFTWEELVTDIDKNNIHIINHSSILEPPLRTK